MADPKLPGRTENEMLRSAVAGLDANDLKRVGRVCFTEWLAARERARLALISAQLKDVPDHSWKGHFDVMRLT